MRSVEEVVWLCEGPHRCCGGSLPRSVSSNSQGLARAPEVFQPQQLRGAVMCLGPFFELGAADSHLLSLVSC